MGAHADHGSFCVTLVVDGLLIPLVFRTSRGLEFSPDIEKDGSEFTICIWYKVPCAQRPRE